MIAFVSLAFMLLVNRSGFSWRRLIPFQNSGTMLQLFSAGILTVHPRLSCYAFLLVPRSKCVMQFDLLMSLILIFFNTITVSLIAECII